MRAFVVVIVAVATLVGLGWYFANSQMNKPAASAVAKAPVVQAPIQGQAQAALPQKQNEKIEFNATSNAHPKQAVKKTSPEFEMPSDENEVVGKYVHRPMVYPKAPSREKHVPLDDDLLVMEGRSEDRLSATR